MPVGMCLSLLWLIAPAFAFAVAVVCLSLMWLIAFAFPFARIGFRPGHRSKLLRKLT